MQVLETIAAAHPDIRAGAYGALLLCALCLARGDTVAVLARALGISEQDGFDISKAEILNVAQLTWSSPAAQPKIDSAAKVLGSCALLPITLLRNLAVLDAMHCRTCAGCCCVFDTCFVVSEKVLQLTNWETVTHKLPQGLRLRLLLALIAVYKGAQTTPAGGTFCQWLWTLLDGPVGLKLTELSEETRAINGSQARQFPSPAETWTRMGLLLSPLLRTLVVQYVLGAAGRYRTWCK